MYNTRPLMVLAVALACAAGCSTTRQDRSAKAAESLARLHKLLDQGAARAEELATAASDLSAADGPDVRKHYERFSGHAKKLRAIAKDARSLASAMKERTNTYLSSWEKEVASINNRDLRQMSKERQAVVTKAFNDVSLCMTDLGLVYGRFEQDLSDVEKFVGNDLTATGLGMAKPALERLAEDMRQVKSTTEKVEKSLMEFEQSISPR